MAASSCTDADSGNIAAVLHGIDDLRVQPWPLSDELAPGHVSVYAAAECMQQLCHTHPLPVRMVTAAAAGLFSASCMTGQRYAGALPMCTVQPPTQDSLQQEAVTRSECQSDISTGNVSTSALSVYICMHMFAASWQAGIWESLTAAAHCGPP